jgi:hypothetical protein
MSSPSSPPPISHWVPDEEGAGCSICHAEFSLTRRRHHCRKCGSLVCGSCSDHFISLDRTVSASQSSAPVRVCDRCEVTLRQGTKQLSEEMDVSDKIGASLKLSLKEKVHELEKFQALLLQVVESSDSHPSGENDDKRMEQFMDCVHSVCARLREVSSSYSDVKMASKELDTEIRAVAQRCMRSESIARDAVEIPRDIEKFSKQIGSQDRLILQLNERIQRLSCAPPTSPPSSPPPRRSSVQSPASPVQRSTLTSATVSEVRPDDPTTSVVEPSINVRQVLKALVRI